jgi:hypothetical protein
MGALCSYLQLNSDEMLDHGCVKCVVVACRICDGTSVLQFDV